MHLTCIIHLHTCRTRAEGRVLLGVPLCLLLIIIIMVTYVGVCATAKSSHRDLLSDTTTQSTLGRTSLCSFCCSWTSCIGHNCLVSSWQEWSRRWPWQESAEEEGGGWRMMYVHVGDGYDTLWSTAMLALAENPSLSSWIHWRCDASSRWRRW